MSSFDYDWWWCSSWRYRGIHCPFWLEFLWLLAGLEVCLAISLRKTGYFLIMASFVVGEYGLPFDIFAALSWLVMSCRFDTACAESAVVAGVANTSEVVALSQRVRRTMWMGILFSGFLVSTFMKFVNISASDVFESPGIKVSFFCCSFGLFSRFLSLLCCSPFLYCISVSGEVLADVDARCLNINLDATPCVRKCSENKNSGFQNCNIRVVVVTVTEGLFCPGFPPVFILNGWNFFVL